MRVTSKHPWGLSMERPGFCSYSFLRGLGICLRGILRSLRIVRCGCFGESGMSRRKVREDLGISRSSLYKWFRFAFEGVWGEFCEYFSYSREGHGN